MENTIKVAAEGEGLFLLFFNQQQATRLAFTKTYGRRLFDTGFDLFKRISIKSLSEQNDLYMISEFTDHRDAPTTMESWKAYYNWSGRQLIEIGGKKRTLYFDTENDTLYKETLDAIPYEVEIFPSRSWKP
nr:hypothetical protein [Pedobacter sp. ASV19]